MKPVIYKRLRIFTLLVVAVLYVAGFWLNFPETVLDHVVEKLVLSIAFLCSLLLLSFLLGNSRSYLIGVSIYCGVVCLSTATALLLRDNAALWVFYIFLIPYLSFLPPLMPIGIAMKMKPDVTVFLFLLVIYGFIFAAHRFGKSKLKE